MLFYNYLQGRYILELSGVRYTLKALTVEAARLEARTLVIALIKPFKAYP